MKTDFSHTERIIKILIGVGLAGMALTALLWGVVNAINNESILQKPKDNTISVSFYNDLGEKHSLKLEVADTAEKRTNGLMNRTSLDANSGMLFVFEAEQPLQFWMKNTLISLDIIFLDSELIVNTIHEYTLVNQTITQYPSSSASKYAIEVNAGWSDRVGLQKNDQFFIE